MNKYLTVKIEWLLLSFLIVILLSGCASIGKGAAQAVLEKSENEDTRQCQVWGKPFMGIEADLAQKDGKTKVLFVHGVGDHIPGYTTEFLEKLAKELNLNARSEGQKNIELNTPLIPGKALGNLRITHLLKGAAIFAKDFSGLPARKISKKLRDRQCLRLPRFVLVTSSRPNKGSKHRLQMT